MSNPSPQPPLEPTVYEAANDRFKQVVREIQALQQERQQCLDRMAQFRWSKMLESERIATKAEPYQTTQLPVRPCFPPSQIISTPALEMDYRQAPELRLP